MTTITLPRATVEQALEALTPWMDSDHTVQHAAYHALRAALAQEQAEQAWVCPDSPEHRYAKPGHCEDCGKTLVQEQGCDHCNHPLYAATRCRVCGRVTEQAEPVEPVAWYYERDTDKGLSFAPDRDPYKCWQPLHTAPPQRKPLTDEEIDRVWDQWFGAYGLRGSGGPYTRRGFARAIERAHGINHSKPE